MRWSEFVDKISAEIGKSDPDIDYIDVDICYKENPEIKILTGREPRTIKIFIL